MHGCSWLQQNSLLGLKDGIKISLKILAKLRRDLVEAADQGVAVGWVALALDCLSHTRAWVESLALH